LSTSSRDLQIGRDTSVLDGTAAEPPRVDATETAGKGKAKSTLSLQSIAASVDTISGSIPFDESPLTFEPEKYVPLLRDHWAKDGGNASYALLTRCFVLVNGTTSRIKIVDTFVNCLRVLIEGDPESLLPAVSLLAFHQTLSAFTTMKHIIPKPNSPDNAVLTITRSGCRLTPYHLLIYP
jgi:DNA ligase 1